MCESLLKKRDWKETKCDRFRAEVTVVGVSLRFEQQQQGMNASSVYSQGELRILFPKEEVGGVQRTIRERRKRSMLRYRGRENRL